MGVAAFSVATVPVVVFGSAEGSGLVSSAVDMITDVVLVEILMML